MPPTPGPACPACGAALREAMYLLRRRSTGTGREVRACEPDYECPGCAGRYSRWADRPDEPLTGSASPPA